MGCFRHRPAAVRLGARLFIDAARNTLLLLIAARQLVQRVAGGAGRERADWLAFAGSH